MEASGEVNCLEGKGREKALARIVQSSKARVLGITTSYLY